MLRNVFPDLRLQRSFATNRKVSSANQKASTDDAEGFFRFCGILLLKMRKASKLAVAIATWIIGGN